MPSLHSRYLPWLLALTVLFVQWRVLAQAVQSVGRSPVAFLPPFDAWQGSALPYPLLLTTHSRGHRTAAYFARARPRPETDAVRPATWKHTRLLHPRRRVLRRHGLID